MEQMEVIRTKRCSRCGEVKDRSEFNKDRARRDGLTSECKSCRYKVQKELHKKRGDKNIKNVEMVGTKRCSKCGEVKNVREFNKDGTTKDGLHYLCRSCVAKVCKERYKKYSEMRATREPITNKRCSGCGKIKDVSEFCKSGRKKDGFDVWCKSCRAEAYKARMAKIHNPIWDWVVGNKMIGMKRCPKCGKMKDEHEFFSKKGDINRTQTYCKPCQTQYDREWREQHRETVRESSKRCYKRDIEKRPNYHWARGTLRQHEKKGIKIEITPEELEEMADAVRYCPLCGCELKRTKGYGIRRDTTTLDRINNENVIRRDNILIICDQCNRTKGERTLKEFIDYCKHITSIESEISSEIKHERI